jgi:hypothetical protein
MPTQLSCFPRKTENFSKLEREVNDWLAAKGDSIQPVNSQTATCAVANHKESQVVIVALWYLDPPESPRKSSKTLSARRQTCIGPRLPARGSPGLSTGASALMWTPMSWSVAVPITKGERDTAGLRHAGKLYLPVLHHENAIDHITGRRLIEQRHELWHDLGGTARI